MGEYRGDVEARHQCIAHIAGRHQRFTGIIANLQVELCLFSFLIGKTAPQSPIATPCSVEAIYHTIDFAIGIGFVMVIIGLIGELRPDREVVAHFEVDLDLTCPFFVARVIGRYTCNTAP
ncbi:hypothetical protein [Ochrobactrum sp. BTU1]|uniref:hypothetical protein n=1 Tax=Ochrobactrum sp. BTU1 TaxID=2840456 RepID=UPI00404545E0